MWTNEQTAALIAAIEEDTLKSCRLNDDDVPYLYYESTMEKCVFDLPRDWTPIAVRLNRTGKLNYIQRCRIQFRRSTHIPLHSLTLTRTEFFFSAIQRIGMQTEMARFGHRLFSYQRTYTDRM